MVAGRYRITGRLGRGGMGTVWRADDELLRRPVAVKELHLAAGLQVGVTDVESGRQHDRALREARSVARIRHPHVVVVHDVVEQDGRPWIVMELVEGRSLADVLREDGPLRPREAARICGAVAGALLAAHQHGIQHRDVKPANVLIERASGRVVLTDFGIARIPGSATISDTGSFVGSPEYTAPERMAGRGAGPESDLWSLGALLCAAVDGQSPFHRESIAEVVHAVAIDDITPPGTVGPLLPVVRGLLDRDPARRMAAAEVRTVLMAYAETGVEPPTPEAPTPELPTPDRGPVPVAGPPSSSRRRTAAVLAGAALIAVVAGATAALLVNRGDAGTGRAGMPPATAPGTTAPAAPTASAAKPSTAPARPVTTANPTAPALPSGYRQVTDPRGFSVALPAPYEREPTGARVYYWLVGHTFRFGEREQQPDPRGPYAVMHDQDTAAARPGSTYPGYRDGVITATTMHGREAALWEFTYDGFGDGRGARRTLDLCWTEDGRMYDVWLSAPVARTEAARSTFDTIRASFTGRAQR
ncbi:Serine/threonine protein kinase [Actinacidiphila rubida]|uniref:non-specific serine/threonine protein kinase n=1 Tax=Actinacidiphila rubida TaxID=310780 RepID=A0A1H8MK91_9ACTN|nr:Serine/threonine protein kinase [Actinacidiphila rubida]